MNQLTAIGNERIRSFNTEEVAFTVRAENKEGSKGAKRLVRLAGTEFVRRFLQHVLPSGIKRIRHYGVLAPSCKAVKLSAAREALQVPTANPQAMESAQGFMARVAQMDAGMCPCCKMGRLQVTAVIKGKPVCLHLRPRNHTRAVGRHEVSSEHGLGSRHKRLGVSLRAV
ncbi:transposase [uncultured Rhodoferax sp.]|uniref:transposase n=1 Tax=uncultured Rhodoferax sp. TaxID=223188 RepID=UPI0025E7B316|nr:transposase [uncultured Rhodoferax sp.]